MTNLSNIPFRSEFIDTFPGEDQIDSTPRQTPGVLYGRVNPSPVKAPKLLAWSEDLAKRLNLDKPFTEEELAILAGNKITSSMRPYAARYGGHQFGHWAGQLGDGRAITLGEIHRNCAAEKKEVWELQLKGAGRTPYSRTADGKAVLRSSVREYLMSEAMHFLGVPTTRALSLATTGEEVLRDMFYDGNPAYEPGAVVARMAPSFLRFGNFEILAANEELKNLESLAEWTINNFYPEVEGKEDDRIISFFSKVVDKTAALMVEWLRVGFVHGVMNTDNMSILGLTIDYGPYSMLDEYDLSFTPNTTDLPGRRYAFGRQPMIAFWNLQQLAKALAPLVESLPRLQGALNTYEEAFFKTYYKMMANKMGLDLIEEERDGPLLKELDATLVSLQPDMTIFYQLLEEMPRDISQKDQILSHFSSSFYQEPDTGQVDMLFAFIKNYLARLQKSVLSEEESRGRMRQSNPRFILRNYLLHQAAEELENGKDQLFNKLQEAIKRPYSKDFDEFLIKRPQWANQKAGCSMLSCSS